MGKPWWVVLADWLLGLFRKDAPPRPSVEAAAVGQAAASEVRNQAAQETVHAVDTAARARDRVDADLVRRDEESIRSAPDADARD